eukprot:751601-Hanusia_phi.AAC.1
MATGGVTIIYAEGDNEDEGKDPTELRSNKDKTLLQKPANESQSTFCESFVFALLISFLLARPSARSTNAMDKAILRTATFGQLVKLCQELNGAVSKCID